jgi:hypothetical protein
VARGRGGRWTARLTLESWGRLHRQQSLAAQDLKSSTTEAMVVETGATVPPAIAISFLSGDGEIARNRRSGAIALSSFVWSDAQLRARRSASRISSLVAQVGIKISLFVWWT